MNVSELQQQQPETEQAVEQEAPGTLLFVDDEDNILSSLKRLFRPLKYRIFTANGGARGLEILEREAVDVVVSDMRMPEMSGAEFLEQVAAKWPKTVRIMLTGYADLASTVDAINKGQIFQYVSKPWEDNDIALCVRNALETKRLADERQRLEQLTQQQNEELKDLNANLEAKVLARTEEVRQTMAFVEQAHEALKDSYGASIKVFSSIIEMREGRVAGHARRVADHAAQLAQRLGMTEGETQDVTFAALLHDIGKMGLPDELINKPFSTLTPSEADQVMKHPAVGQGVLMALDALHGAARLIRSHHERFDGAGYPDGLKGKSIFLGARILAVANDYDALQMGTLSNRRLSVDEARDFLAANRGKRYDSQVVDEFLALLREGEAESARSPEYGIKSDGLRVGMVLARDLVTSDGILLLAKDHILDEKLIGRIQNFESTVGDDFVIYVRAKRV